MIYTTGPYFDVFNDHFMNFSLKKKCQIRIPGAKGIIIRMAWCTLQIDLQKDSASLIDTNDPALPITGIIPLKNY